MHRLTKPLAILLAMACSGCLVGRNYTRPEIDVPETWRFEDEAAKDTANSEWWSQFQDPALDALINEGLEANKDILIAAARIQEFAGRLQTTRSELFPQINANASGARARSPHPVIPKASPATEARSAAGLLQLIKAFITGVPASTFTSSGLGAASAQASAGPSIKNPANTFQAGLDGSWQIDLWGRIRRATESARADLLATEDAKRGVILSVATSIATAYVNLRGLDRQLEIASATATSREQSYNLFKLRYDAGVISELELSQTKALYEQALATVPVLVRAVAQQENALSVLLGRNPGPIERGTPLEKLVFPAVPEGLPSSLLENRPDIVQAEHQLISANALVGAAQAQYFPSISLTGAYGWASDSLSHLFSGDNKHWDYAVPVTTPIFTGGRIAGQVRSARAVRDETLITYRQTIQTAFREVEDALINQRTTREQLAAIEREVEALRKYAYFARRRFDNGYTSYIEVLDAERTLFGAELSAAQTRAALFQALVGVYQAMGGGWIVEAEQTPETPAQCPKAQAGVDSPSGGEHVVE
ncbi:MAG: efflux transporter outer membrane subunit [Candidatus Hydrogenedentes bacterium]|nr:efflux transporter outer membrane subunit [Candidatus Hydrogenedentota bacterium]